ARAYRNRPTVIRMMTYGITVNIAPVAPASGGALALCQPRLMIAPTIEIPKAQTAQRFRISSRTEPASPNQTPRPQPIWARIGMLLTHAIAAFGSTPGIEAAM